MPCLASLPALQILALRVPTDLPTKQLAVDIEPYSVKGGQQRRLLRREREGAAQIPCCVRLG